MSNQARAVALAQYDAELELKRKIAEIERLDATTSQKDELIDRARVVSYQRVASAQTKAYNDEWNKAFDQASQSLSDALMAGGKNGAEYIEGLFRSLVLRPVIQAIVAPIAGDIASTVLSMLGMGPSGSSGGGSGMGLGNVSTMYRLGTSSMMKDFGLGLGNLVNNAGGKLYNLGLEKVGSSLIDFGDTLTKYSGIVNKAGAAFSYVSAILKIADGKWGRVSELLWGSGSAAPSVPLSATGSGLAGQGIRLAGCKPLGRRGVHCHHGSGHGRAPGAGDRCLGQHLGRLHQTRQ